MSFEQIQQKARQQWQELTGGEVPVFFVGTATCGTAAGAGDALATIRGELADRAVAARVVEVGCVGLCYAEPVVIVNKPGMPGVCFANVTPERGREIVESYVINNEPPGDYALGTVGEGSIEGLDDLFETPGLKGQVRRVLGNCGFIDPGDVNHYIAHGGYSGLANAIAASPADVIEQIKQSGLRGRGGAGFPTWRKWQFCASTEADRRYVVCNADEGDPGAFMNRSLLEGDPHSVLEGMIIAGYALGACQGYIYCRAEYPLALKRLRVAISQLEKLGLLGDDVLGSGCSFHIKVKEGAGAFVCGEETALIHSIEGKRGMPRPRPPFPSISGLWGKPTVINNVETLGSVALIMRNGPEWYSQYGTEKSKGTKTFALAGKVNRTGLIEVPLGTTPRQIIFDICGGILDDKKFKAVQTGGPSGGCIPEHLIDTPVDYESLAQVGSIMGSGGMVVMDEETCMVDIARYFLEFANKESCGECVPCRLGTRQMLEILTDITKGKGKPGDIDLLEELAESVHTSSLCGLGQTAPNPVLTTIRYFRDEYEAHVNEKKCPAKACTALIHYEISPEKCRACGLCLKACPVGAITGQKKVPHVIDQDTCIRCGICLQTCPDKFNAVECVSGEALVGKD